VILIYFQAQVYTHVSGLSRDHFTTSLNTNRNLPGTPRCTLGLLIQRQVLKDSGYAYSVSPNTTGTYNSNHLLRSCDFGE
jgi:hypothetical protein